MITPEVSELFSQVDSSIWKFLQRSRNAPGTLQRDMKALFSDRKPVAEGFCWFRPKLLAEGFRWFIHRFACQSPYIPS